ncbi:hypothetical protein DASC09_006480 [Saccharomycopsis crataegensis]|uniref:Uncharacterized protein n=1 Tax=Saccharomycopsis crataegensis TaxID=43959 RepID=A0AAV5QEZ9_9ASCO|nr:hypothetical protein DASC09_006480 [Saccharomycopsis crataegensis]
MLAHHLQPNTSSPLIRSRSRSSSSNNFYYNNNNIDSMSIELNVKQSFSTFSILLSNLDDKQQITAILGLSEDAFFAQSSEFLSKYIQNDQNDLVPLFKSQVLPQLIFKLHHLCCLTNGHNSPTTAKITDAFQVLSNRCDSSAKLAVLVNFKLGETLFIAISKLTDNRKCKSKYKYLLFSYLDLDDVCTNQFISSELFHLHVINPILKSSQKLEVNINSVIIAIEALSFTVPSCSSDSKQFLVNVKICEGLVIFLQISKYDHDLESICHNVIRFFRLLSIDFQSVLFQCDFVPNLLRILFEFTNSPTGKSQTFLMESITLIFSIIQYKKPKSKDISPGVLFHTIFKLLIKSTTINNDLIMIRFLIDSAEILSANDLSILISKNQFTQFQNKIGNLVYIVTHTHFYEEQYQVGNGEIIPPVTGHHRCFRGYIKLLSLPNFQKLIGYNIGFADFLLMTSIFQYSDLLYEKFRDDSHVTIRLLEMVNDYKYDISVVREWGEGASLGNLLISLIRDAKTSDQQWKGYLLDTIYNLVNILSLCSRKNVVEILEPLLDDDDDYDDHEDRYHCDKQFVRSMLLEFITCYLQSNDQAQKRMAIKLFNCVCMTDSGAIARIILESHPECFNDLTNIVSHTFAENMNGGSIVQQIPLCLSILEIFQSLMVAESFTLITGKTFFSELMKTMTIYMGHGSVSGHRGVLKIRCLEFISSLIDPNVLEPHQAEKVLFVKSFDWLNTVVSPMLDAEIKQRLGIDNHHDNNDDGIKNTVEIDVLTLLMDIISHCIELQTKKMKNVIDSMVLGKLSTILFEFRLIDTNPIILTKCLNIIHPYLKSKLHGNEVEYLVTTMKLDIFFMKAIGDIDSGKQYVTKIKLDNDDTDDDLFVEFFESLYRLNQISITFSKNIMISYKMTMIFRLITIAEGLLVTAPNTTITSREKITQKLDLLFSVFSQLTVDFELFDKRDKNIMCMKLINIFDLTYFQNIQISGVLNDNLFLLLSYNILDDPNTCYIIDDLLLKMLQIMKNRSGNCLKLMEFFWKFLYMYSLIKTSYFKRHVMELMESFNRLKTSNEVAPTLSEEPLLIDDHTCNRLINELLWESSETLQYFILSTFVEILVNESINDDDEEEEEDNDEDVRKHQETEETQKTGYNTINVAVFRTLIKTAGLSQRSIDELSMKYQYSSKMNFEQLNNLRNIFLLIPQ